MSARRLLKFADISLAASRCEGFYIVPERGFYSVYALVQNTPAPLFCCALCTDQEAKDVLKCFMQRCNTALGNDKPHLVQFGDASFAPEECEGFYCCEGERNGVDEVDQCVFASLRNSQTRLCATFASSGQAREVIANFTKKRNAAMLVDGQPTEKTIVGAVDNDVE